MSEEGNENKSRTLQIPIIKAESEAQTTGLLVSRSPDTKPVEMEADEQKMSIRKRRNLSKNRGQAARQREKTPEPGRTPIHEDTPTSDDEDVKPPRNSREIEADKTYQEMRRLVQEQSAVKHPVYDLDTEEILEARVMAAHERRRRSISPFALPEMKEDTCTLERKGSFIDPTNKLLSTSYTLSPKEEQSSRRNSLTIETPKDQRSSLSPPTPQSASPKDKNLPFPLPAAPKKLEKMVYPDEVQEKSSEDKARSLKTPISKESVFDFEDQEQKSSSKAPTKSETPIPSEESAAKPIAKSNIATKPSEPPTPGELVTKVIQVERTPSRKMSQESRPIVEVRERIVRTPSRKMSVDTRPIIIKQQPKSVKDEPQSKLPPVKPARSKSATRFGVSFYIKLLLILFIALLIALYFQLA